MSDEKNDEELYKESGGLRVTVFGTDILLIVKKEIIGAPTG